MLAGPNVTMKKMKKAMDLTMTALQVASVVDVDRTEDDRAFLQELRAELVPVVERLQATDAALRKHDVEVDLFVNMQVRLGDAVLDRGLRKGNGLAKIGLKGQTGLDASHVFGEVEKLIAAPIRAEPTRVLEAMARMDDLADFQGRDALKADLIGRAQRQERFLAERDQSLAVRSRLESEVVKAIVNASAALVRTKGLLDGRFPHQRWYVAEFFFDVSPRRRAREVPDAPAQPGGPTPEAPAEPGAAG